MSKIRSPNDKVVNTRGRKKVLFAAIFTLALLPAISLVLPKANVGEITVYLSPNCGCCKFYVEYLKREGFKVKVIETENIAEVKDKFEIPKHMRSCHTSVIGNYFIEGHVPVEAIEKLLDERPEVDGIILPGMPPGSPGMPGVKEEQFVIYSIKDEDLQVFAVL